MSSRTKITSILSMLVIFTSCAHAQQQESDQKSQTEAFMKTAEYARIMSAFKIMNHMARIEVAQKEQQRQRDIAKESGFMNKYAMQTVSQTIVDTRAAITEEVARHHASGGSASTSQAIRSKLIDCLKPESNAKLLFMHAETGYFYETPTKSDMQAWDSLASCLK